MKLGYRIIVVIAGIGAIFSIIGLADLYNNHQNESLEVKASCNALKQSQMNLNISASDYNQHLSEYNNQCGSVSGYLGPMSG